MFMGLGMPIPDLSNKPGPGRPGWGPIGFYDFQFRVEGTEAVVIKANAAGAGNFRISWPNGTTDTYSGNNASITAPDATDGIVSINNEELDTTYCDEFAVIGSKSVVREVISWGKNPWTNLSSAFLNCTNLTGIGTTGLLVDASGSTFNSLFEGCTSLTAINMTNWDLSSGNGASIGRIAKGCVNLEQVDIPSNKKIKFYQVASNEVFRDSGTSTTNGCVFNMQGLDSSTTTTAIAYGNDAWFRGCKISPSSNFTNWVFNSSLTWNMNFTFYLAEMTGTNSTLDISGWSTLKATSFGSFFRGFNSNGATPKPDSNFTINVSNLNLSHATNLSLFFGFSNNASNVKNIIGLSTLPAMVSASTNTSYFIGSCPFLKLTDDDNLSDAFMNSLNSNNASSMFQDLGQSLTLGDYGKAPNLAGLNLSASTTVASMFRKAKFSNAPDFSNVIFPTAAVSYSTFAYYLEVSDTNAHLVIDRPTFKPSTLQFAFANSIIPKVTIGDSVDLSAVTTFQYLFLTAGSVSKPCEVTLPTTADYGGTTLATSWDNLFNGLKSPLGGTQVLSTCVGDTFIRRLHASTLNTNPQSINLYNTKITESPSVVNSNVTDLETAGWTITDNSTDATIPFEYTGTLAPNTTITPTNNTGSPFTGTKFSSTNSNIAVNATTGVINTPNGGNTTIRYTLDDGCFTEQAISLVSAEFSYSASAYCQDAATDPIPTVTGTSGGAFSAVLKVIPFQMQFEVDSGTQKTISIPGVYGTSFTIDWGDGFTETSTGGGNRTVSHIYNDGNNNDVTNPTVTIGATGDTGAFYKMSFVSGGSRADLLDVPQWGNTVWTDMQYMFNGCNNTSFQISATDYPDMSNVTNLTYMFYQATHFNSNIDHWDVSNITNLFGLFRQVSNYNQPLNSWDVSSVTNFDFVFASASSFNSDISSWDMSSCETTRYMFQHATSFNQNISGWNFSSAWTNPYYMFYNSSSFNQNLNSWNVSGVTTMDGMLRGCTNFNNNGGTLSAWNVSSVTSMSRMFQSSTSFVGTGLDSWNPSSCTDLGVMFYGASSFNQNLSSWSLNSSLTSATIMFHPSSMSQANYTDTLVGWANTVFTNSAPYSVNFTGNSFSTKFDGTRTYNSGNFSTAQDAYNYLIGATASWSIS